MNVRTPSPGTEVRVQSTIDTGDQAHEDRARVETTEGRTVTLHLLEPDAEHLDAVGSVGTLEVTWEEGDRALSVPARVVEIDVAERRLVLEAAERREHMRVDSSLLFSHCRLGEAEFADMAPRVMNQPLEYLEEGNDADRPWPADENWERIEIVLSNFHRMLRETHEQVQQILARLEGRENEETPEIPSRVINISGSGLAFEGPEAHPSGTKLRMTFNLSRFPFRSIVCLGEVVRSAASPDEDQADPKHLNCVRFTHIREEDRDRVIHYVFKMQRRLLRHRRAGMAKAG